MKQPDFVQFQIDRNDTPGTELESPLTFSRVREVVESETLNKRKSHGMKKDKTLITAQELELLKSLKSHTVFPLSITLLNLLRDPQIFDHEFDQNYLLEIEASVRAIIEKSSEVTNRHYVIYMHLVFSQIQNLQELENQLNFDAEIVPINHEAWNWTNIMNTNCILANLKNLNKKLQTQPQSNQQTFAQFSVNIVEDQKCCIVINQELKISRSFIETAMNSHGHWDIYFAPFIIDKFETSLFFRYLSVDESESQMYSNYAKIFLQLCAEQNVLASTFTQNWYENQLQKLINEEFSINEIEQLVYSGVKNANLEKLLIGLMGWKDDSDRAVKLLNCYYDSHDWQSNDPTKPVICQIGENFSINYLIENSRKREKLVICLKAPCFNSQYNHYFFSFHKPKLNEYSADKESYLWIQAQFGKFKKSGFYDWIVYFANKQGKQTVNKILNIAENQKLGSQIFSKAILDMKNVKGRFIIHPQKSRKMQIHQIFIDSILSDQGSYKSPTFADVIKEVQVLKNSGVNTVFISGVFQRDNGQFQHGFKRPQASSMAVTNRIMPSSFLGGEKEFKKLVHFCKVNNVKLIVDCLSRVSSSRMSKKYQSLKLMTIDEKGRKNYFYGSEGRGMNYEQTAILNYRKKEAWNLLLEEVIQLIEKYQIDGIHLDNGHVCPQIYEIDKEELSRIENGRLIYTHEEIFEGHIINPKKKSGYWNSKATEFPNPFYIFLTQNIWNRHPNFTFISECYETQNSTRFLNAISSGFIPRLFKLPKALSQIVGIHLHENGSLSEKEKKPLTRLAKWYQEMKGILPKNSILIQSTTNHIYPYPALIFKKATWAFIDLFFFLPEIPMTFSKEYMGRAYRTKALNMFIDNQTSEIPTKPDAAQLNAISMTKKASYSIVNSTFFEQETVLKKKQKITVCSNTTLRDSSQLKYLSDNFRKEVGPQFGFDLAQIHRHYEHRRQLREKYTLLSNYRMVSLSAEHLYGIHTNVISFAKYDDKEILLISTNFNETAIDMHYNLTPLKFLFTDPANSDLILKIEDVLHQTKFVEEYYTVGELLTSKIEQNIKAYSSSIWKISVYECTEELLKKAFVCSQKRIAERISRNPPQWIYSSIFTNQLSRLIVESKTLKPFVNGLNKLYNEFIVPLNINFNLVISKTHDLFVHKVKLQKLFGILKLLQLNENKPYFEVFEPTLRNRIQILLKGNELGPIAFVAPEVGSWSSVGGLGVMVDELSKELVKLKETVYMLTPYYEYNKKKETGYLARDGFVYDRNIKVYQAHFQYEFGIHRGNYEGVNYIWFHNPELFSRPYDGEGAMFVTKQMVFFALATLQAFCQLQIFPSSVITNDWMCGFVAAYVKVQKYKEVFNGTKFMHIVHNLDPLYEGRLYPKYEEGDLNWLIQLPREWYLQHINNKMIINPSKCALETCDNWGTVSHSYKIDLLKQSPLADVLWKHPHAFSFPNGVRKDQRISIIHSKTPGDHYESKKALQQKYFGMDSLHDNIPLFAFIGRVTKQKGVHLIIDAIQSLLHEFQFQIQFLIGGPSDSKQEYGKYCAQRMKYLTYKYPKCVWSNPDAFFTDGAIVNIGSDYAMMPSLFEPGGIVQHQFFCGGTPVVAFRTGGLKDSVFEYDMKTKKGNGFNFMSYDVEDFKRCMRRAISCFKNKQAYLKLRQNAFDSVIQVADVARGWNSELYRLQNKIYIDWEKVDQQIASFTQKKSAEDQAEDKVEVLKFTKGEYWKKVWQVKKGFKEVLKGAQRLSVKMHSFCFETEKIPRPKEVMISGTWNNWKQPNKMNFDKIQKNWKISLKLKPGTYHYKYIVDGEWSLTKDEEIETDLNNIQNHIVVIE